MPELFRPPLVQVENSSGAPLSGAKLYVYQAGTTTLVNLYQNSSLSTPETNPVIADSTGMFPAFWLTEATYKTVLTTSTGTVVKTVDNIPAISWDGLNTKGASIASATSINLTTATGPRVDITGTTTITAVTLATGAWRVARAVSAFQLTASASLVVNGSTSTNYTTTAGDLLFFEGYSGGVVRVWVLNAPATNAETISGTVTNKGVTPAGLAAFFANGQIKFPAAQNASADANTLDDYEEGTWTPAIDVNASATGITYNSGLTTGIYTKIGRFVWIYGRVVLTNKGGSTGGVRITGLPFAATGGGMLQPLYYANMSSATGFVGFVGGSTSTTADLNILGASASSTLNSSNITNTSDIIFAGVYSTS